MFQELKIAPSILSGDFIRMDKTIALIGNSGADWVHIDVMDGHFVPNITMGIPLVKQLNQFDDLFLDAHLMVTNPLEQIPWFIEAGCDMITFHLECLDKVDALKAIDIIHSADRLAGCALKPDTDIGVVEHYIDRVDMVLVMSVFPGFSGQGFIAGSDKRISEVVKIAKKHCSSPLIQVDGGINLDTAECVLQSGADVLVCGNAFYKNPDPSDFCSKLKNMDAKLRRTCF